MSGAGALRWALPLLVALSGTHAYLPGIPLSRPRPAQRRAVAVLSEDPVEAARAALRAAEEAEAAALAELERLTSPTEAAEVAAEAVQATVATGSNTTQVDFAETLRENHQARANHRATAAQSRCEKTLVKPGLDRLEPTG